MEKFDEHSIGGESKRSGNKHKERHGRKRRT